MCLKCRRGLVFPLLVQHVDYTKCLGIACRLVEDAFSATVHVTDKDTEQYQSHYSNLPSVDVSIITSKQATVLKHANLLC